MSSLFQTGWFVESLLSQTLIVYVIRTGKIPFKDSKPSLPLVMTTMLICVAGIILPYTILGQQFQMNPMPSNYWYGLAVLLPCYLLLTQLVKMWFVKKWGIL
jgi:Mg2+-importing ATPase